MTSRFSLSPPLAWPAVSFYPAKPSSDYVPSGWSVLCNTRCWENETVDRCTTNYSLRGYMVQGQGTKKRKSKKTLCFSINSFSLPFLVLYPITGSNAFKCSLVPTELGSYRTTARRTTTLTCATTANLWRNHGLRAAITPCQQEARNPVLPHISAGDMGVLPRHVSPITRSPSSASRPGQTPYNRAGSGWLPRGPQPRGGSRPGRRG